MRTLEQIYETGEKDGKRKTQANTGEENEGVNAEFPLSFLRN